MHVFFIKKRHIGDAAITCHCPAGYKGTKCEIPDISEITMGKLSVIVIIKCFTKAHTAEANFHCNERKCSTFSFTL